MISSSSIRSRRILSCQWSAFLVLSCIAITHIFVIDALSIANGGAPFNRFQCQCPADASSIRQFDATLDWEDGNDDDNSNNDDDNNDDSCVWAAVYRSNNNLPTVLLKDDLLNSMRIATNPGGGVIGTTSTTTTTTSTSKKNWRIETSPRSSSQRTPVAVARLRPSTDYANKFVLDNMRCWLKKEDTNADCDGGSEHTEALSVAIDALLLHYLNTHVHCTTTTPSTTTTTTTTNPTSMAPVFEQTIRTKATLVSGQLLEDRGFQPVQFLEKDMATHVSSLDDCLHRYADRTLNTSLNSNMQTVALQILSKLGQLDRNAEMNAPSSLQSNGASSDERENTDDDDDDDEYDPWAGIKQFI